MEYEILDDPQGESERHDGSRAGGLRTYTQTGPNSGTPQPGELVQNDNEPPIAPNQSI